jgi:hypothetical protein
MAPDGREELRARASSRHERSSWLDGGLGALLPLRRVEQHLENPPASAIAIEVQLLHQALHSRVRATN